ncbi:MAG: hypothetical protein EAZ43_06365 [Betaproteobacteria bacterium]|nr:MAG: hypothetical protein EAZ43_06365 [Betaproteobacteria bacterium]
MRLFWPHASSGGYVTLADNASVRSCRRRLGVASGCALGDDLASLVCAPCERGQVRAYISITLRGQVRAYTSRCFTSDTR